MEPEITILIADNHAMFRDSLRCLLEQEPGFRVVGDAADGREVIERVRKLKPGVLLLDYALPQLPAEPLLQRLSNLGSTARIIMLAAAIDQRATVEVLRLGACGVVLKDSDTELLFKAIRTVMAGELWIGHAATTVLLATMRNPSAMALRRGIGSNLSSRQREIVAAVAEGLTNLNMARKFSISERTVKRHLTNIFKKVGVTSRLELALLAIERKFTA